MVIPTRIKDLVHELSRRRKEIVEKMRRLAEKHEFAEIPYAKYEDLDEYRAYLIKTYIHVLICKKMDKKMKRKIKKKIKNAKELIEYMDDYLSATRKIIAKTMMIVIRKVRRERGIDWWVPRTICKINADILRQYPESTFNHHNIQAALAGQPFISINLDQDEEFQDAIKRYDQNVASIPDYWYEWWNRMRSASGRYLDYLILFNKYPFYDPYYTADDIIYGYKDVMTDGFVIHELDSTDYFSDDCLGNTAFAA